MLLKCGEGGSLGYSLGNQALESKQCEKFTDLPVLRVCCSYQSVVLAVSRAAYSLSLDHVAK